jgi:hypothetical protein
VNDPHPPQEVEVFSILMAPADGVRRVQSRRYAAGSHLQNAVSLTRVPRNQRSS